MFDLERIVQLRLTDAVARYDPSSCGATADTASPETTKQCVSPHRLNLTRCLHYLEQTVSVAWRTAC
jgi:hypothetical protein